MDCGLVVKVQRRPGRPIRCVEHGISRAVANMRQIHEGQGEHWRAYLAGMRRAHEAGHITDHRYAGALARSRELGATD